MATGDPFGEGLHGVDGVYAVATGGGPLWPIAHALGAFTDDLARAAVVSFATRPHNLRNPRSPCLVRCHVHMCPVGRAGRPRQYVQEHRADNAQVITSEMSSEPTPINSPPVPYCCWGSGCQLGVDRWTDGRGGGLSYAVPNPSNTRGVRRSVEGMRVQDTDGPLPGIQSDDAATATRVEGCWSKRPRPQQQHTYTQTPTCHRPPGAVRRSHL